MIPAHWRLLARSSRGEEIVKNHCHEECRDLPAHLCHSKEAGIPARRTEQQLQRVRLFCAHLQHLQHLPHLPQLPVLLASPAILAIPALPTSPAPLTPATQSRTGKTKSSHLGVSHSQRGIISWACGTTGLSNALTLPPLPPLISNLCYFYSP